MIFTSNEPHCEDVAITDDDILEDTESFRIILSTSDPDVILGDPSSASVMIVDNDSECMVYC